VTLSNFHTKDLQIVVATVKKKLVAMSVWHLECVHCCIEVTCFNLTVPDDINWFKSCDNMCCDLEFTKITYFG